MYSLIEPVMYIGLGSLATILLALVILPLVHARAVRLTLRRLEAATPVSVAEIQADKDQLRAENALATRRLEMDVEQLKTRMTSQLAELGKKTDMINRLKIELCEKTAAIFALEARVKVGMDQLHEEQFSGKTETINQLKVEVCEKTAAIFALEARINMLVDQLHASEAQPSSKAGTLANAERAPTDKEATVVRAKPIMPPPWTLEWSHRRRIAS